MTNNEQQQATAAVDAGRWHIDPTTGDPAECLPNEDATCPLGITDTAHRQSIEDTYRLMEQIYAAYLLPVPLKRTGPVAPERLAAILAWRNPSVCSPRPPARALTAS